MRGKSLRSASILSQGQGVPENPENTRPSKTAATPIKQGGIIAPVEVPSYKEAAPKPEQAPLKQEEAPSAPPNEVKQRTTVRGSIQNVSIPIHYSPATNKNRRRSPFPMLVQASLLAGYLDELTRDPVRVQLWRRLQADLFAF